MDDQWLAASSRDLARNRRPCRRHEAEMETRPWLEAALGKLAKPAVPAKPGHSVSRVSKVCHLLAKAIGKQAHSAALSLVKSLPVEICIALWRIAKKCGWTSDPDLSREFHCIKCRVEEPMSAVDVLIPAVAKGRTGRQFPQLGNGGIRGLSW